MAGATVKQRWSFPRHENAFAAGLWCWASEGDTLVTSEGGEWTFAVNWINGVPYANGYPGVGYAEPPPCPTAPNVWDTQIGGDHYTKCAIQPFQYSMANKLDPMQHTIIKYVTRFRDKAGIQDLEKAKQTIDLLIQWEKDNATPKSK